MATNRVENGASVDVILASDTNPGEVVAIGTDMAGVAEAGGKTGQLASVTFWGVYRLPKASGAGTGFAAGMKVYYDKVLKQIKSASGANTVPIGHTFRLATDADATVEIRLCPGA